MMHTSNHAENAYSLNAAAQALLTWAHRRQHSTSNPIASRLQLPVVIPYDAILPWLRAHPARHKLYFRARHSSFQVAAIGFSYRASGPTFTKFVHARLLSILDASDPQMRFYGASRFHNVPTANPSSQWAPYDGYTFVLPAVELLCDTSGRTFLAVNLYQPTGISVIRAALAAVIAPSLAVSTADPTLMIPHAVRVDNVTGFPAWDNAMADILHDITSHEYDKIVLVRQKRFLFHENAPPRPLHILAALAHQNALHHPSRRSASPNATQSATAETHPHTNAYLFCLQLDDDTAFLGCTPERLFKLEGSTVLTEALASTVRLSPRDDEATALATLLNRKNADEHRFVVDYVTAAMSRCGFSPITDGPHVRRLPRLMHLSTHISATLPSLRRTPHAGATNDDNDVFRLLYELHPTPAVCGVPRQTTIARIAEVERFDRGLFAGPFGWFSAEAADFCVAIRSASVHGLCVTAYAGSGIVQASESASEWEETELKMSAFTDLFSGNVSARNSPGGLQRVRDMIPAKATTPYNMNGFGNDVEDNRHDDESMEGNHPVDNAHSANGHLPEAGNTDGCTARQKIGNDYFDPNDLDNVPNLNTLWGCCCIEELCRNGINAFFVSPGSRSAPLALGIARSRHAQVTIAHDERGAGYLAVGYARATGRPAAVVTSSGTAVANLLPAVVEAAMDELPVLLLTADRPPELRDVGANQAIRQVGIFGSYVAWQKDVACPCDAISLRNLLSDVDHAVFQCGGDPATTHAGLRRRGAPVHLNMMFREKLAPDAQPWDRRYVADLPRWWRTSVRPMTSYRCLTAPGVAVSIAEEFDGGMWIDELWEVLKRQRNGLILLGGGVGGVRNEDEAIIAYELSEALGWPVVSDVCGGLRFDRRASGVVHYADVILSSGVARERFSADAVLQFGERVTSKRVKAFVRDSHAACDNFVHMLVTTGCDRSDEHFTVTHRVHGDVSTIRDHVQRGLHNRNADNSTSLASSNGVGNGTKEDVNSLARLVQLSAEVDKLLDRKMEEDSQYEDSVTEPWCARIMSKVLGGESRHALFIGNSMPIRDLDMYGSAQSGGLRLRVVANRGASGIDGVVSSGIGYAIGSNLNTTIVVGDMSFIHDINALHLIRAEDCGNRLTSRVTIVVVNNGGGGIFSMLPIAKHESVFTPLFDTPHRIRFHGVCETFRVGHVGVEKLTELEDALRDEGGGHRVIEVAVPNDHKRNACLHASLTKDIVALVDSLCHDDGRVS